MHIKRLSGAGYLPDGEESAVEIHCGIAPWVIPLIATGLTAGGAVLQNNAQNRANRKQFEHQQRRQREQHDARMRANAHRLQALERQGGFDAQRQSEFARALQEGFGPGRETRRKEKVSELNASQKAARQEQHESGRLGAGDISSTKGRGVKGNLGPRAKAGEKKNKSKWKRRSGHRSTIGSYRAQREDDAGIANTVNQQMAMNSQRARSAAALDENMARILGQVPPEEHIILNPNSLPGTLATAAGAGLFAYAPYAPTGGPIGAPNPTGPVGRGGGRQWWEDRFGKGTPLPGTKNPNPGPWGSPGGGA